METDSNTPQVSVVWRDFDAITSGDLGFVIVPGRRSIQRGDVLTILAGKGDRFRQRSSGSGMSKDPSEGLSAHVIEATHVVASVDGLDAKYVVVGFKRLVTNGMTGSGWVVSEVDPGSARASRG